MSLKGLASLAGPGGVGDGRHRLDAGDFAGAFGAVGVRLRRGY